MLRVILSNLTQEGSFLVMSVYSVEIIAMKYLNHYTSYTSFLPGVIVYKKHL